MRHNRRDRPIVRFASLTQQAASRAVAPRSPPARLARSRDTTPQVPARVQLSGHVQFPALELSPSGVRLATHAREIDSTWSPQPWQAEARAQDDLQMSG